jgi:hypothetical protein
MFARMAQLDSRTCLFACLASTLWLSCGGTPPPPKRGVLERDVSSWKFRRYQQVQEVEVWIEGNTAVAHTASYVRAAAEKEGRIKDGDLVNAFVTRYQDDRGVLRAVVVFARRLAQESGYEIEEDKRKGVRLITIKGRDEAWVLWPARGHVVKLGGRYLAEVPDALIDIYGERYPSRMTSGMLDGPLPPEEVPAGKGDKDQEGVESDSPTPDWQKYKPGELDTPNQDEED